MKRLMIPLDGSEFAERALAPAINLARRTNAEVHLVSVVSDLPPVPLASGDGELVSRWFEEEEARANGYLEKVADRLRGEHPGVGVSTHVRLGPVARTLEEMASKVEADLVVLTTHGRGAWQRAWLGSVADQLVRKGTRPLLLIRDGEGGSVLFSDGASPAHILVPLDGSEAAQSVLATVRELGGVPGKVSLVSVLLRPFPLATSYLPHAVSEDRLMEERKAHMEEALDGVKRALSADGLAVDTRVIVADDVAGGLLDFAERKEVDLIAMSTRGRGGVSRFFLGSVADKVIRGAAVPLLLARRNEDQST